MFCIGAGEREGGGGGKVYKCSTLMERGGREVEGGMEERLSQARVVSSSRFIWGAPLGTSLDSATSPSIPIKTRGAHLHLSPSGSKPICRRICTITN